MHTAYELVHKYTQTVYVYAIPAHFLQTFSYLHSEKKQRASKKQALSGRTRQPNASINYLNLMQIFFAFTLFVPIQMYGFVCIYKMFTTSTILIRFQNL